MSGFDEELRNIALDNSTPVGTKMYPEDLKVTLGSLLSDTDFDSIKQVVDKYVIGRDWDGSKHPEHGGYNAAKAEARQSLWGDQKAGDVR